MNGNLFGKFLCSLRMEKGLSQTQLGDMLGVPDEVVLKWENGMAKPNTDLFPRLSEIFGVTVEELFACRCIEENSELVELREQLNKKRKKYAIFSSIYYAFILCFPLMIIDFISIILGFDISVDIAGPWGAIIFAILLIASVVGFFIYRGAYTDLPESEDMFSPVVAKRIRIVTYSGWLILWFLFVIMIPIRRMVLWGFNDRAASVYLAIYASVLILLFGTAIFFSRLVRLSLDKRQKRREPTWGKHKNITTACIIGNIILFSVFMITRMLNALNGILTVPCIISGVLCFSLLTVTVIHEIWKK